jgi:hypothetical protein
MMIGNDLQTKEKQSYAALQELGLEVADRWASGFQNRPTQQLVLQKIIDPVVKHIIATMSPWIIGMALLFLLMIVCTVITCVIVLRSNSNHIVYYSAASALGDVIGASV